MTDRKSSVHEKEREFHDDWASTIDPATVMVDLCFTGSTSPEGRWIAEQLGDVRGKKLLELGSGAGEGAVWFAKHGAVVTATDLSAGMLDVAHKVAALHGVTITTRASSAEDLSAFADGSFDIVYAANLLHHVDIAKCLAEVRRVLKPNGMAAFWDPVAHNPLINVYRRMATEVRTEDEHPIRRSDLKKFAGFSEIRTGFFWLTSLMLFVKFYLVDRVHPNEDRYWKRILVRESELRWLASPLMAIDRFLVSAVPLLGWLCWNVAVVVRR